jgi:glutamate dehydrogenase (NAD(P)+)
MCPSEHPVRRRRWVICDSDKMSKRELERLTRRYTAELIEVLGPEKDVPGPDINTDEQIMAWIMDTYSMHMRHTVTAVVTGKPLELGGSHGRTVATGRGLMIVCDEALERLRMNRDQTRVIIQGFGNVGSNAARLMHQRGYKIVGVSTSTGGLYNKNGIDIDALWMYHKRTNTLMGFPGTVETDSAELLVADCDILIPAAVENQITSRNADRLKARILCEGANGPTTAEADDILADKRVFVIPDILANSGGVTASYFEWVDGIVSISMVEQVEEVSSELQMFRFGKRKPLPDGKIDVALTWSTQHVASDVADVSAQVTRQGP